MGKRSDWWARDGEEILWSADVIVGAVVGCSLFIGAYFYPSVVPGPTVLTAEAVVGGAILAVVLTALAILVAFLGDEYVALLEKSVGVRKAILPYQAVAVIAAAQVLCALIGLVVWGVARDWGHDAVSSVTTGLAFCAVIGTVQIVNITAKHGMRRARIPEIRAAAKEARQNLKAG
jgi:hypothetical protein